MKKIIITAICVVTFFACTPLNQPMGFVEGFTYFSIESFMSPAKISWNESANSKNELTSNSPEKSGIYFERIKEDNDAPIRLDSVTVHHVGVPILKRNSHTPVLQVQVHTSGVTGLLEMNNLTIDLSGTTELQDLKGVGLFYTGNDPDYKNEISVEEGNAIARTVTFKKSQPLKQGVNYFWVTAQLGNDANIRNILDITCTKISIGGKTIIPKTNNPSVTNKLGVALRKHKDDNVDTYRIPGLATTNKGTLIAVYDIRRNNGTDLQEDIDIGMNRSADGGISWESMKVIMDMEEWGGLPDEENGIGDPSILVDRQTNTIWVAAIWAHGHPGKRNWWASKQGVTPKETSQFMLVKSEDDGITWSQEINITGQIKDPKWHLALAGPGKGITMKDGTLVFPAQFKDENEMPHATIIWSQDHGKSWTVGTGAKDDTTEAQVIERKDGSLMLNMRDNRNGSDESESNGRSVYVTQNLGRTWEKHVTSRTNVLQEPVCMASLIKEDFMVNGDVKSLVLFSNPNSKEGRHHISIKVSFDDGESWDLSKTLLLDAWSGRGYSCMTKVDENTVGILYEGSQADMTFQLVSIDEIMEPK